MNSSDKKKKAQERQLQIKNLDQMLWLTTPLGKILSSLKEKTQKVLPIKRKIIKYKPRDWVVRIPGSLFGKSFKDDRGFQTVVTAETPYKAWEAAANCDEWEILDFPVRGMVLFPKDPL